MPTPRPVLKRPATNTGRYEYGPGNFSLGSDLQPNRNDLLVKEIFPDYTDGSLIERLWDFVTYGYNRLGEVTYKIDQNGTAHQYEYDDLGRLVEDRVVALGTGIDGTVRRIGVAYTAHGSIETVTSYGKREGISPTFTSLKNWVGRLPKADPEADKKLVRKFLHCYGPTTVNSFTAWLGCSDTQARRLWKTVADEIEPVQIEGKPNFMLTEDMKEFSTKRAAEPRLILLGAYDPYLDQRDRAVILDDKSLHKIVWRTTTNPGAVVKGGRIIGTWKSKIVKTKLDISLDVWESVDAKEKKCLENLAENWTAFRELRLENYVADFR